ncbi:hypothetical protein CLAIMM_02435 [Cladophialophora immunda]|nr:hypothetical protein CLAIMM_02435 [Cladophialophora immunda]
MSGNSTSPRSDGDLSTSDKPCPPDSSPISLTGLYHPDLQRIIDWATSPSFATPDWAEFRLAPLQFEELQGLKGNRSSIWRNLKYDYSRADQVLSLRTPTSRGHESLVLQLAVKIRDLLAQNSSDAAPYKPGVNRRLADDSRPFSDHSQDFSRLGQEVFQTGQSVVDCGEDLVKTGEVIVSLGEISPCFRQTIADYGEWIADYGRRVAADGQRMQGDGRRVEEGAYRMADASRRMGETAQSIDEYCQRVVDLESATISYRTENGERVQRDPDAQFGLEGRSKPTLIIEVAWSQSKKDLERMALEYIKCTQGEIRAVVGLDVDYAQWKSARLTVWRAVVNDKELVGVSSESMVIRSERGVENPDPKAGLRLSLADFATHEDLKQCPFLEMIPIFIGAKEICAMIDQAEQDNRAWKATAE